VYLCVLCGSESKQRLFPYTTLTGLYNLDGVFYCAVQVESVTIIQVSDGLLNGLERCAVFAYVSVATDNGSISRSKWLI